MSDWFIVQVRSGSERLAAGEIELFDRSDSILTYVPVIATWQRPHRAPRKIVVLKPAFPGYAFVNGNLENICPCIEQSSRCYRFITSDYQPLIVAETVIARIKEQEREWRKHPVTSNGGLIIGESVIVTDGPFANFNGVILNLRKRTAEVALAIRGKLSYRLWAPLEWLKTTSLDKTVEIH